MAHSSKILVNKIRLRFSSLLSPLLNLTLKERLIVGGIWETKFLLGHFLFCIFRK
jgi:hypothetical protein